MKTAKHIALIAAVSVLSVAAFNRFAPASIKSAING